MDEQKIADQFAYATLIVYDPAKNKNNLVKSMHARLFNISGCEKYAPIVTKLLKANANGKLYGCAYKVFSEWTPRAQTFLSAAIQACVHNIKVEAASSIHIMRDKMKAQGFEDAHTIVDAQVFDCFTQIYADKNTDLETKELLRWNSIFTKHLAIMTQLKDSMRLQNKWAYYMHLVALEANKENTPPLSQGLN